MSLRRALLFDALVETSLLDELPHHARWGSSRGTYFVKINAERMNKLLSQFNTQNSRLMLMIFNVFSVENGTHFVYFTCVFNMIVPKASHLSRKSITLES